MLFQLIFECFFSESFYVRVKTNILLNSVTRKISFFFATEYCISESADGSRRNNMPQGPLQETISKADTAQPRFLLLLSAWNEVSQTTTVNCLIRKFKILLTRDKVEKCKQVKITSYFVKEKQSFTVLLLHSLCVLVYLPRHG